MRTGLSNFIESVQTSMMYKLGCSTDQDAIQTWNQPKTGASTMNKNECKRCSECKHYRPIEQQAAEDIGDCTLYPEWIEVFPYHYCGQWASAQDEPKSLDIDWSQVPEGYDWIAQDSNGDIYAWPTKPVRTEAEGGYWRWRGEKGTQFYFGSTTWREADINKSLALRPATN